MLKLLFGILFTFCAFSQAVETIRAPHVEIDWLAPRIFASIGETLIGIRFRPENQWHVYWKNPGDSGAVPKFKVTAQNAEVGEILWPIPKRLSVSHLTNFGFENEAVYMFRVKSQGAAEIKIEAELEWLVCQEECVPGLEKLTLIRKSQGTEAVWERTTQQTLEPFVEQIPRAGKDSGSQIALGSMTPETLSLQVLSNSKTEVDLFPMDIGYLSPAKPLIKKNPTGFEFQFQLVSVGQKPKAVSFLLVQDNKAYEFKDLAFPTEETESLWWLLVSALIGGILLNLMPCVFPVISVKAVSLLKTPAAERTRDGIMYTLGVLVTFAALGAGFLFLRHLGSKIGWGFQLQSPLVVYSLILLFWMMALNFLGLYEFGNSVVNVSGRLPWRSSFATGVLSVFVAAPCTGPFMGTALGATATLPALSAMLIFVMLGAGLALPYLILTLSPALTKRLPRSGAWMETLKQFLAFPLFATVIWLAWVLGQQTGTAGWSWTSIALLATAFGIWLGKGRSQIWQTLAALLMILVVVFAGIKLQKSSTPNLTSEWISFSEEKLRDSLKKGESVFVDFTAAWCITCQVNKAAVLETQAAAEVFQRSKIKLMRADWTNQDPAITEALARLGRNSVPVYVFYHGGPKPVLLPQILTMEMIRNLIPNQEEK